jgi:hypothetical protein
VRILTEEYGGGTVWYREGTLAQVTDELLDLPDPDASGAPRLVKTRSLLWTP